MNSKNKLRVTASNLKPNITFEDKSTKAVSWRWQLGATGYSTKPNLSYIFKDTGEQKIKLYVLNTEGCITENQKTSAELLQ